MPASPLAQQATEAGGGSQAHWVPAMSAPPPRARSAGPTPRGRAGRGEERQALGPKWPLRGKKKNGSPVFALRRRQTLTRPKPLGTLYHIIMSTRGVQLEPVGNVENPASGGPQSMPLLWDRFGTPYCSMAQPHITLIDPDSLRRSHFAALILIYFRTYP